MAAFANAAASMRDCRYWARNPREQIAFLLALRDVLTEVCFHLDRNHVLNQQGLRAFAAAASIDFGAPWLDPGAGTVLLSGMDEAIKLCLATLEASDNTEGDPTTSPS